MFGASVLKKASDEKNVLTASSKDDCLLVLSSGMNHLRAHLVQLTFCTCTSVGLQRERNTAGLSTVLGFLKKQNTKTNGEKDLTLCSLDPVNVL